MRKHDRLRLSLCTVGALALVAVVGALLWEPDSVSAPQSSTTTARQPAELIDELLPLSVVPPRPGAAEEAPAEEAPARTTAVRPEVEPTPLVAPGVKPALSDLDVVSPRSLALVVELRPTGVTLLEQVEKAVPYRVLNGKHGAYTYAIEDGAGEVLFEGRFEVPELCTLQGVDHVDEHRLGHVVLSHTTSVVIRVPHAGAARRVVFKRQLPEVDVAPLVLGRVDL